MERIMIPTEIIVTSEMIFSNTLGMDSVISYLISKSSVKNKVTVVSEMKVTISAVVYSIFRVILVKDILFLVRELKYRQ